jgi:hypothetical protein
LNDRNDAEGALAAYRAALRSGDAKAQQLAAIVSGREPGKEERV